MAIFMSGLALLAAGVCLVLLIQEKKRNQKRNAAAVQLIQATENQFIKELEELKGKVSDLMEGVVPDFNEALAAKNAVDEFNMGLSAIIGFDPMEAVKKSRQERLGTEE